MKIIRKSNYDHEDYRGDQFVVAEKLKSDFYAKLICKLLNEHSGEHSEDFFEVVPDDHILQPDWEP